MAGERFLIEELGVITEQESIQVGGAGSENRIPSLDSNGFISESMLPPSVINGYVTGTATFNFGNETDYIITTILNAQLTLSKFKCFTFIPVETAETSLDDFSLNGLSFVLENIVDNLSFDIRATASNNASGVYTINYIITYS